MQAQGGLPEPARDVRVGGGRPPYGKTKCPGRAPDQEAVIRCQIAVVAAAWFML
jgi:hypothetical protein